MKIIHVTVKAHPKRPTAITSVAENGDMVVTIGALPIMGKANKMLLALLAQHFDVSPSQIVILKGQLSSHKTVQIN